MTRSADLVVIGGGIIGVSVACVAAEQGAQVILLERSKVGMGCSYGNAGLIVPGYSLPLARPRIMRDLPRLLFSAKRSPKIRLRLDIRLLRWLVEFFKASHREKMRSSVHELHNLGRASVEILKQWSPRMPPFEFKQRGWLHAYDTKEGYQQGTKQAAILKEAGVDVEFLDTSEARSLEPGLSDGCVGGIFFPTEAEVEPYALVSSLAKLAQERGVVMLERTEAVDFSLAGNRVSNLETRNGPVRAGEYVVAAGAWSRDLVQKAIGWLPIEPAKGYSITTEEHHRSPNRPLMEGEDRIVVTPFKEQLRLTTGLDLVGFHQGIDQDRIRDLQVAGSRWLSQSAGSDPWRRWYGFRPMTPDGLPIVGRSRELENLWIASGHGQRGMTLAPVTGKLIVDLLTEQNPVVDPKPLSPDRFRLGR